MEYLVKSHEDGKFYVTNETPIRIMERNTKNGTKDIIFHSWEKGDQNEALDSFFEDLYKNTEKKEKEIESLTRDESVLGTHIYYACFREMIENLYDSDIITKEHKKTLLKNNKKAEKKQLKMIKKNASIFKTKKLTLKNK